MNNVQDKKATNLNTNRKTSDDLTDADHIFLKTHEATVSRGQTDAALALHALHSHEKALFRLLGYKSFPEYAMARFGYKENHTYRMCRFEKFLNRIADENAERANKLPLPPTEGFYRELNRLGNFIEEVHVLEQLATAGKPLLASEAKGLVEELLAARPTKPGAAKKATLPMPLLKQHCQNLVAKLREKVSGLPPNQKVTDLLAELEKELSA